MSLSRIDPRIPFEPSLPKLPSVRSHKFKARWRILPLTPEEAENFDDLYSISFGFFMDLNKGEGDFQEVVLGASDMGRISVVAATGEIDVYKLGGGSSPEGYIHRVEVYKGEEDSRDVSIRSEPGRVHFGSRRPYDGKCGFRLSLLFDEQRDEFADLLANVS